VGWLPSFHSWNCTFSSKCTTGLEPPVFYVFPFAPPFLGVFTLYLAVSTFIICPACGQRRSFRVVGMTAFLVNPLIRARGTLSTLPAPLPFICLIPILTSMLDGYFNKELLFPNSPPDPPEQCCLFHPPSLPSYCEQAPSSLRTDLAPGPRSLFDLLPLTIHHPPPPPRDPVPQLLGTEAFIPRHLLFFFQPIRTFTLFPHLFVVLSISKLFVLLDFQLPFSFPFTHPRKPTFHLFFSLSFYTFLGPFRFSPELSPVRWHQRFLPPPRFRLFFFLVNDPLFGTFQDLFDFFPFFFFFLVFAHLCPFPFHRYLRSSPPFGKPYNV